MGAFESRIGTHESNLAALLRLAGVRTVYTVGLALDFGSRQLRRVRDEGDWGCDEGGIAGDRRTGTGRVGVQRHHSGSVRVADTVPLRVRMMTGFHGPSSTQSRSPVCNCRA